ncbi:hypothetical protein GGF46_003647 [Coemansia sp. RSA 552]|nr:hypothetical protein GGF46_003647 [Coemansia sp. RSA 552]
MSLPVLFVTRELPSQAQQRLESLTQVEVRQHKSTSSIARSELLRGAAEATGLICLLSDAIDGEFLQHAGPQLKVVSTISVGYDHVDTGLLKEHGGIRLGYTPDVLTGATADTTVLLALMAARRAKEALHTIWTGTGRGFSLSEGLGTQFTNKTLGIVGFGRIGQATAHRLAPFGFARTVFTASKPRPDQQSHGAEQVSLDQLLRESDLVCVCCPLNDQTRGMFDEGAFGRMKRGAILVNTARGAIVNQDALLAALGQEKIAAAGLDVTVPEPLPKDHPLVRHPRCVVLPHIGSATEETRNAMANLAIDNALAGISDQPMEAEVAL